MKITIKDRKQSNTAAKIKRENTVSKGRKVDELKKLLTHFYVTCTVLLTCIH